MNSNIEIWKDIPSYIGYYQTSDWGRVKSLDRIVRNGRFWKGQILKPVKDFNGRLYVNLSKHCVVKRLQISRLILSAFIGSCPDNMECLHKNDNCLDNRLKNLYWGTKKHNAEDAIRNGKTQKGVKHHNVKLKESDIFEILKKLKDGKTNSDIAKEYGVRHQQISRIKNGKRWKHITTIKGDVK